MVCIFSPQKQMGRPKKRRREGEVGEATKLQQNNVASIAALCKAIVERFNKVLLVIDAEAERLEQTGEKKPYRIGDNSAALQRLHTGTLDCPLGFDIEIGAQDYKRIAKMALKTEVYGNGSNPRPLLQLIKEAEDRQQRWHEDAEMNCVERAHMFGKQTPEGAKKSCHALGSEHIRMMIDRLKQKARQEAAEKAREKRQEAVEKVNKAKREEIKMQKQKKAELEKRPLVSPPVSSRDGHSIVTRLSRARPGAPDRDDIPGQSKGSITLASNSYKPCISNFDLGVNIFLANRQINAESSPIFYSANLFNFEGVPDLYAFLCHFQHRLSLMRKLGLTSVTSNPKTFRGALHVQGMPLHSVFPLLASAINLEAVYMHAPVWQSLGGRADIAARAFFQMGWTWMLACALAKGNKLGALDVIKLPEVTSELDQYGKWQVERAGQALFRSELAGRLTAA
ncbi:hypothetical protein SNOG_07087 [Parastagonospora nodorum SN15]|uniref:Uncharacterized protein n=1 Tax=Phaeosphaeria nodorum (strain SN15 / ATCC MYA-4574 / FGSC 10173) TaxID=321614 RepID=Q0UMC7_PHANO|nr:hypothetical protein SNOG_07087 [Parastagonospora nodorum SN15]EAT85738.2 hypothetical protein SNOG_07087 [Parastagonospora nodorum SN15]